MKLLTCEEVAALLRVSVATVYRHVKSGFLPAVKLDKRALRFDEAAVKKALAGAAMCRPRK